MTQKEENSNDWYSSPILTDLYDVKNAVKPPNPEFSRHTGEQDIQVL